MTWGKDSSEVTWTTREPSEPSAHGSEPQRCFWYMQSLQTSTCNGPYQLSLLVILSFSHTHVLRYHPSAVRAAAHFCPLCSVCLSHVCSPSLEWRHTRLSLCRPRPGLITAWWSTGPGSCEDHAGSQGILLCPNCLLFLGVKYQIKFKNKILFLGNEASWERKYTGTNKFLEIYIIQPSIIYNRLSYAV